MQVFAHSITASLMFRCKLAQLPQHPELAADTPCIDCMLAAYFGLLQNSMLNTCLQMVQLEDLPDLALKEVLQNLSTDQRRRLSCTSQRFRRLIGESWTHISIALEGSNLVDSANLQLKWLLARDVFRLERLVSSRVRHVFWRGQRCLAAGLMQEADFFDQPGRQARPGI